jgi:hypothetical protein
MRYNPYKDHEINGQMHIWLQYCGFCPAKLATEFKVGDRIAYNTGISHEVVAIEEKSPAFLTFTVKNKEGDLYRQNVKKTVYKPYV